MAIRMLAYSLACWWFVLPPGAALAASPPPAAIASAHPLATRAGHEVLAHGGNAFDAAVAITAALAVVEPMGSGLGGGGFWLLHRAADDRDTMIDGREKAPAAAAADMYLDHHGVPIPRASLDGALAAAIPGTPAVLVYLAERYGRLPLAVNLAPAIHYAEQGFAVSPRYQRLAQLRRKALRRSPAAAKVFLADGEVPPEGALIPQPELAATLRQLAQRGKRGFYDGVVARRLVRGVRQAGGIWTLKDLQQYRVVERRPVQGRYRGIRITSAAPPSSGGIVLVEMLNILGGFSLDGLPSWQRRHLVIEAMRLAYRDRARFLGDPDYIDAPIERLLSQAYADGLRGLIDPGRANASTGLGADMPSAGGTGQDTSHFSVIDRAGNRVAATLSINYPFGSAFMPPGTGVVLNNEMDDFVIKPGVPNVYGLVGSRANAIVPGKRPLSSMTPTFLESEDAVVVLGTPGGSRIITMVLLAALEFAHGRGEVGYGNMQAVYWDKKANRLQAASDPRGEGLAQVK